MRKIGRVLAWPFTQPWRLGRSALTWLWDAWNNLTQLQQAAVSTWFWYTLALGLVPFGFTLALKMVDADAHPIRYGDLYLLAALVAFAGVGEMFKSDPTNRWPRVSFLNAGGLTLIVGIFDAFLYAAVSSTSHQHNTAVDISSVVLYVLSALCSLGCVVASGGE